jgi:hypothetical protein
MLLHYFRFCGTFRNCKKYCACGLFLVSLIILFHCRECLFESSERLQLLWAIEFETDSRLLPPVNYGDRSATLSKECNRSHSPLCDQVDQGSSRMRRTYQSIDPVTFLLQSKSLMYCAVPKIATKTILSLMTYVYLRDISDRLENNRIDLANNGTLRKQLIGVTRLVDQLKKVSRLDSEGSVTCLVRMI